MRQRSLTIVVLVSALVSALVTAALTLGLDVPGRGGGPTRQAAAQVPASVPELVNFQGILTDGSGNPLSQGLYTVTFRVFDVGTGGTPLWTEIQDVKVDDGLFHVLLGSVTPLAAAVFNGTPRYLEIKVGTDAPMTPRQQFASVPYALQAGSADSKVPSGGIILWDGGDCPSGFSRLASYDDKVLRGSGTAGTEGGSNTDSITLTTAELPAHTHSLAAHSHNIPYKDNGDGGGKGIGAGETGPPNNNRSTDSGGGGTSSTGSGTAFTVDTLPAYRTIILCKKD